MEIFPILVLLIVFGCIFGVFYLFITSRHRERMALIEKGVDASLFRTGNASGGSLRRLVVLNLAFTLIGIGLGITFGILLYNQTGEDAVYPASIFCMAGAGLLASFFVNRKFKDD